MSSPVLHRPFRPHPSRLPRTELPSADTEVHRLAAELRRDALRLVLGTNTTILPGHAFRLLGSAAQDGEWVVERVRSHVRFPPASSETGRQEAAGPEPVRSHLVDAVPRTARLQPRTVEKPRIQGTLSATVVGDDEIDVDAQGRILMRFPWDRRTSDERALTRTTRRVRVAHPWAGPSMGQVALPRVGHEVLVAFLGGDPDEPIVVGSLHNGRNIPPLDLPAHKSHSIWHSQSVPGGATYNEVRMVDDAGAEVLHLYAGLDFDQVTTRDQRVDIGRDELVNVMGSSRTVIRGGSAASIGGGQSSTVTGDGEYSWSGFLGVKAGEINVLSGGAYTESTTGEFDSSAASYRYDAELFTITSKLIVDGKGLINLACNGASIEITDGEIVLTAGGSTLTLNAAGITLSAPLIQLNP